MSNTSLTELPTDCSASGEGNAAFDWRKPYRTRDGREVEDIATGAKYIYGSVGGLSRRWLRDTGLFYENGLTRLDLVNIPAPSDPALLAAWQAFSGEAGKDAGNMRAACEAYAQVKVLEEREACARISECRFSQWHDEGWNVAGEKIANAIRARSAPHSETSR